MYIFKLIMFSTNNHNKLCLIYHLTNNCCFVIKVHNGGVAADGASVRERFRDVHHVLLAGDANRPSRGTTGAAGEGMYSCGSRRKYRKKYAYSTYGLHVMRLDF